MPSAEYDLWYLRAGIDQLESYLLSNEIYWPIGVIAPAGEPPYPQLTLGNLLLARQRAQETAVTPTQRAELNRLNNELEATRSRWRVAWSQKAQAEFHARLNLWRNFVEEYRKDPSAHYDRYTYEVGRRVLLQLLEPESESIPKAEQDLLTGLDEVLKAVIVTGEFIWDDELASGFPQGVYWYLYGQVKKEIV